MGWIQKLGGRFGVEKITQETRMIRLTAAEIIDWQTFIQGMGFKVLKPETQDKTWIADIEGSHAAYAALTDKYTTLRPFHGCFAFRLGCYPSHQLRIAYRYHKQPVISEVRQLFLFPQLACGTDLQSITYGTLPQGADKTQPRQPNWNYIADMRQFMPMYMEMVECLTLALTALHSTGYAHCDIKAANVVFCEDQPAGARFKLIDFGIMRQITALTVDDIGGKCQGTRHFCTPYYKKSMQANVELSAATDLLLDVEQKVIANAKKLSDDPRHKAFIQKLKACRARWLDRYYLALNVLKHQGQASLPSEQYQHYSNDYYGLLCIMVGFLRDRAVEDQLALIHVLERWLPKLHPPYKK
jgi:serine/threonine protein kinase